MNTMAAEARRKALCARLARVEGQVRGLQRLIEADTDPEKVAQQMAAARKALDKAFFAMVAGLIADGHHVAWPSIRGAFAAMGPQRLMLVTDAMATIGSPRDAFDLFGETIHVEGGRLVNAEGRLAGAHLDMSSAVLNMARQGGASLEQALMMATATPAAFLGLSESHGRIAPGREAVFSVLRTG